MRITIKQALIIMPKDLASPFLEPVPLQVLSTFCPHCHRETYFPVEAVDGGEAELWRTKYQYITDTLDAISREVDTWFAVNPWREQAKLARARLDALLCTLNG